MMRRSQAGPRSDGSVELLRKQSGKYALRQSRPAWAPANASRKLNHSASCCNLLGLQSTRSRRVFVHPAQHRLWAQQASLTAFLHVQADGNCMYRAVQHQLVSSGVQEAPDYVQLRGETASYMRAFPEEFKPFVLRVSAAPSPALVSRVPHNLKNSWG